MNKMETFVQVAVTRNSLIKTIKNIRHVTLYSILVTSASHLYSYSKCLLVELADISYDVFNGCNLFRTCNNHVYKCFHFIL